MPGPAQPWDQPEDPRDQTVDLPRIDLASFGNGHTAPEPGSGAITRPFYPAEPPRSGAGPRLPAEPPLAPLPPPRREPPGRPDPGLSDRGLPPEHLPRRLPDSSRDPYARPGESAQPGALFRPAGEPDGGREPDSGIFRTAREPDATHSADSGSFRTAREPNGKREPDSGLFRTTREPDGTRGADSGSFHTTREPNATHSADSGPFHTTPEPNATHSADSGPFHTTPESDRRRSADSRPSLRVAESASGARPSDAGLPDTVTAASTPTAPPLLPDPPRLPDADPVPAAVTEVADAGVRPATPASAPRFTTPPATFGPDTRAPASDPDAEPRDRNPAPAARRRTAPARPLGRPAPGSMHDLIGRLDRLPDGHPSSPYEDGGLARPLPHRLRQLELGLPAPEREPADAGQVPDAGPTPARDVPAAQPRPPAETGLARAEPSPAAPPPVQAGAEYASAGRDPYAAPAANGHGDSGHRPAPDRDLALRPWRASPPESNGRNGPAADHPARPDDQEQLVTGLLAACRAAEGRNARGEYGESGLTPALRRIAHQLPRGGLAPDSEADTLKPAARLAAKLERLIARHPGRSPEELAAGIGDGVRYAFTFDPDYYTEGTWLVHRKLKAYGFELEARRNRWDSPEYKGVWTRWRDPAHGLVFEVQFHTGQSWDVLQRTHAAYVQITDPATPAADRARLRARQVSAATSAKAPPNCTEISDFGREAR
jgi:hypothetical protein